MSDADGDEGDAADSGAGMDDASDASHDARAAADAMLLVMLMLQQVFMLILLLLLLMLLRVVTLAELLAAHAHAVAQHIHNCPTLFLTPAPPCPLYTCPNPCLASPSLRFGMLATVSVSSDTQGLPLGSVVEFAANDKGQPVFAVSTLSAHCADLEKDQRASLTVMSPGFSVRAGAAQGGRENMRKG